MVKLDYNGLGRRIRERRRELGLTQLEFADRVGISSQHLSNVENGRTKLSMHLMVAIATEMNCSIDDLFFNLDSKAVSRDVYKEITRVLEGCDERKQALILELAKAVQKIV